MILSIGPERKALRGGTGMITIVLADDHQVVRQGFRALLETEPDLKVIGEAADGDKAVQLVENLQPDVLVLDLVMTGTNGLEVTRQVAKRSPKTAVVILSMYSSDDYVLEALRAKAKGYVLKESGADELVTAIRVVVSGRRYIAPPLSERVIDTFLNMADGERTDSYDGLTAREREVLYMAARGIKNAEIADKLFISRRTVEAHRTNMMRKLGLHSQIQLVRYAMQRGILPQNV
jgi:DNA-binding NarL/FixJ family response regulator